MRCGHADESRIAARCSQYLNCGVARGTAECLLNNGSCNTRWHSYELKFAVRVVEEMTKPEPSSYCPISVSEMATNNSKLRQNSVREFSHAQNAAHRAFCRAPGRPQTAAFGRVYFGTRRERPSLLLPSRSNLGDCVVASKATVMGQRNDRAANISAYGYETSPRVSADRRPLSRAKTARKTRNYRATYDEDEAVVNSESSQNIGSTEKEKTVDFLVDLDLDCAEEKNPCNENNQEVITPSKDCLSESTNQCLTVYHTVDSKCSCGRYHDDSLVPDCCCCNQVVLSSYSVEIQGEGYQSTPGLGNSGSQENEALYSLLEKQLSLVCHQNFLNQLQCIQHAHLYSLASYFSSCNCELYWHWVTFS